MAKKKRTSRRRRIGGAGLNLNSPVMKLAAVAGAYFLAADPVNGIVDKGLVKVFQGTPATATDGTVSANTVSKTGNYVGVAVEGFAGYMLMKKSRGSIVKTLAGAVLVGAALKRALKVTGVVTGYRVNGYQQVPVIAGYQQVPVIGARKMGGYGVNGRPQSVMGNAMDRGVTAGSDLLGG